MCGIAGIIAPLSHPPHQAIGRMVATVLHRGPDGDAIRSDQCGDSWVALGHTRLAILDLTEAGNQPMCSSDGNYVLIYNGEVYNYLELRAELEARGRTFHSDCDTEVVLSWIGAKAVSSWRAIGWG